MIERIIERQMIPMWQSDEAKRRALELSETGDVVHILPQGRKGQVYSLHGWPEVTACVDERSEYEEVAEPTRIRIWNPRLPIDHRGNEGREMITFGPEDVWLIVVIPAEDYIPLASRGILHYGDVVPLRLSNGEACEIEIDSFFGGIISGRPLDGGNRIFAVIESIEISK